MPGGLHTLRDLPLLALMANHSRPGELLPVKENKLPAEKSPVDLLQRDPAERFLLIARGERVDEIDLIARLRRDEDKRLVLKMVLPESCVGQLPEEREPPASGHAFLEQDVHLHLLVGGSFFLQHVVFQQREAVLLRHRNAPVDKVGDESSRIIADEAVLLKRLFALEIRICRRDLGIPRQRVVGAKDAGVTRQERPRKNRAAKQPVVQVAACDVMSGEMLSDKKQIRHGAVIPTLKINEGRLADRPAGKRLKADVEQRLVVGVVKCLRHLVCAGKQIPGQNPLSPAAAQQLVGRFLKSPPDKERDKSGPVGPRVGVEIDFREVAVDGFIFRIVEIVGQQHLPDRVPEAVGKQAARLHLPEGVDRAHIHGFKLPVPDGRGEPEPRVGNAERIERGEHRLLLHQRLARVDDR